MFVLIILWAGALGHIKASLYHDPGKGMISDICRIMIATTINNMRLQATPPHIYRCKLYVVQVWGETST